MGRNSAHTLASRAKPAARALPDSSEEEQERLGKRGLPDSSEDEEQRVITIARKRSQGCQDVSKQADGGTAAVKEEGGAGREGQAGAGAPGGKRVHVPPDSIEDEEEQNAQTSIARDGSEQANSGTAAVKEEGGTGREGQVGAGAPEGAVSLFGSPHLSEHVSTTLAPIEGGGGQCGGADAGVMVGEAAGEAAGEADEDEMLGQMPGSNDRHDTAELHVSQPQQPSDSSDNEDDVPLGKRATKLLAEEPQSNKPVKKRPRGEPQDEANCKACHADPESPLTLTLH